MGRIIVSVTIENMLDPSKRIRCSALVDTAMSHLTLPSAWSDQLGDLPLVRNVEVGTGTWGTVRGPVKIEIAGFQPISSEVLFVQMEPTDDAYEPLLGHIPLAQSQAAVDVIAQRLRHVKRLDLKPLRGRRLTRTG